jgi:hypothetical protein
LGEGSTDETMDREGIGLDLADEDSSKLDKFFSWRVLASKMEEVCFF